MNKALLSWLLVFFGVLIWSAIGPHDYPTWALEVAPAVIAFGILVYTRKRFPLTPLTYTLILVHCVILIVGGHYTYAKVPLGDYVSELLGWERNNYDKLGHLAQGFVPAIIAREISVRLQVFRSNAWMNVYVVGLCLGISAFYEMIEWWVALLSSDASDAFLGTQGYVWDTQSDMAMALLGAIAALLTLGRVQDRQIHALQN
ncbi:MAG TPA: DUF2238 domain-containing protein [Woeseiaceae bacterium]|nr:DUF2238 domain-containing protein [Woeseiaceae bacterium]